MKKKFPFTNFLLQKSVSNPNVAFGGDQKSFGKLRVVVGPISAHKKAYILKNMGADINLSKHIKFLIVTYEKESEQFKAALAAQYQG